MAVSRKNVRIQTSWKSLRVSPETHQLYKIRAAEEGCDVSELADRLVKMK